MSTPAEVENKYVKLHENYNVTFYGDCQDASGTPPATTDLEGWGFFYDEVPAPDHTSGTAIKVVVTPPVAPGEFSIEVGPLLDGTQYYVNAYLYDSQSDTYFYHTGSGNTTAPDGMGFSFPHVDTLTPSAIGTETADLEGEHGNLAMAHSIDSVGFHYDEGETIGSGVQTVTGTGLPGWTKNITGLEHGTKYTYQAWMEIDENGGPAAPAGGTIGISGEEVTFTTASVPPSVVEAVTTTFSQSGSNSTFRTKVEFAGQMDSSGTGLTIAQKLGFFYDDAVEPSFSQPPAGAGALESTADPLPGSVPKDFSINAFVVAEPGKDYYVNAYASVSELSGSIDDDYYYSGGQGSTAAPDGTNYKIPKVTEPAAMTAVLEETPSNFKVTFNANTTVAGTTGHGEKGFYYFINANSGSYYPDNTDEVANTTWDGTAGNFSHEETGLIKSTRYWVRGWVTDDTTPALIFYTTAAGLATPQPARDFFFPEVENTPAVVAGSETPYSFTIDAATNNIKSNGPHVYNENPPIKQKGYRVWEDDGNSSDEDDGEEIFPTPYVPDADKDWDSLTIDSSNFNTTGPLPHGPTPDTNYKWRAIAEVFQYNGATATFNIEAAATKSTKTTIPLTVVHHANPIWIGVYDSNNDQTPDKCIGEITTTSAPFQHIAVKGTVTSAGGLQEVGYFLDNDSSPSFTSGSIIIRVREDHTSAGDYTVDRTNQFITGNSTTALSLKEDYWINFFASDVGHGDENTGNANEFVYDGAGAGIEFQIPKVVNKNIVYSQGGSFANQLKITFKGDVEGDEVKFQSDASGWGFVWIEDSQVAFGEPGDKKVFPHLDSGIPATPDAGGGFFEEITTQKSWTDAPWDKEEDWGGDGGDRWAKRYYVNAFIRDRFAGEQIGAEVNPPGGGSGQGGEQGIVYYPLKPDHKQFVIPKPVTDAPSPYSGYAMTLKGSMPIGADQYDPLFVKLKSYGFYIRLGSLHTMGCGGHDGGGGGGFG